MKKLSLSLFFVSSCLSSFGQEKLGIVNSNYHPVSSIHLNASSSVDSRAYMQLNLAGVNAFAMTNAAYLPKFNFWQFVSSFQIPPPVSSEGKLRKFLFVNGVLDGPAFMFSKKNFGVGIFVRVRSVADMRRMPYEFTDLFLSAGNAESKSEGEINIRNGKFSNMTWAEYGLNFGRMVMKRKIEMITFGGNLKYLTGINLLYMNLADVQGSYSPNGLSIVNLEGKYRTSAFGWNSGRGFGGDLGATYKKMLSHVDSYKAHSKSSHCKFIDYKYKVGLSLRDLGFIRFNRNTQKGDLQGSGDFFTDVQGNVQSIEDRFSTNMVVGESITASLPTALSAQFDYNFENDFYVNATINKNIVPNGATGVQSSNLLSIAPRYETKILEVALPLTFQNFMYPQIGVAFRVRSFVLGFDNLLPLIMKKDTYGVGVYCNLAISLFRNPACKGSSGKVDDCGHYKSSKRKIRRKNSMISPVPRKDIWERIGHRHKKKGH